jgi:hypothetical protein
MGRARVWTSAGCAVALVLGGAVGAVMARRARGVSGCAPAVGTAVDVSTAGPDDILLTEQPWDAPVSAHIGQRLVVVLDNPGVGGWVTVSVDGSAARLVATVGAYDYRCHEHPPAAELAIVRAETAGVATLSSVTDIGCRHVQPPCTLPQQRWRRVVTVVAG